MAIKKINHETDQLALMFCQLGKAAAQLVSDHSRTAIKNGGVTVAVARPKVSANWNEIEPEAIFEPI